MAERAFRLAGVAHLDVILAVGLPLILLVVAEAAGWLLGSRAFGTPEVTIVVPIALLAYIATAIVTMRRVALGAFETFRPALGDAVPDHAAVARSLGAPPLRATVAAIAAFELVITGSYLSSPAARATVPDAWPDAGFVWLAWILSVAVFATIVVYAVHQLRIVTRLHEIAPRIDPFRPAPINAFSRLTITVALALLPLMLFSVQAENQLLQVPTVGVLIIASFTLPLRGMHGRLVKEKRRLLDSTTTRLQTVRDRLHEVIDSGELRQATDLQAALSAVLAEREVISKLPTWPWSATLFRGFASAVLVPIVLWLAIRVLERIV